MTTIAIHYKSPVGDPYKVPRPHYVTIEEDSSMTIRGGEIGPMDALLGFCPTETPDVDDWILVDPEEVIEDAHGLEGWHAQFMGGGDMFGYEAEINRVEILA